MLAALAVRHGAYVAMTNQVGGNDSLVFDGSSLVIRPDGEVVVRAASFREDLVVFDTKIGERRCAYAEWMKWRRCGMRWCWELETMCESVGSAKRWWG